MLMFKSEGRRGKDTNKLKTDLFQFISQKQNNMRKYQILYVTQKCDFSQKFFAVNVNINL